METATITTARPKRPKREARRMLFTDLAVKRLRLPKKGQVRWWDATIRGQAGLSILLSAWGKRSYAATFSLNGKSVTDKIGHVSEMTLADVL